MRERERHRETERDVEELNEGSMSEASWSLCPKMMVVRAPRQMQLYFFRA
jgi:hypothetical protein